MILRLILCNELVSFLRGLSGQSFRGNSLCGLVTRSLCGVVTVGWVLLFNHARGVLASGFSNSGPAARYRSFVKVKWSPPVSGQSHQRGKSQSLELGVSIAGIHSGCSFTVYSAALPVAPEVVRGRDTRPPFEGSAKVCEICVAQCIGDLSHR